nr:MAG TPA: hypothetical protein [Caudoviricetes sp.]
MKNKMEDTKEREERPVEVKDTVFFAERGRMCEILKGSVVVILEHCEMRLNETIRTNRFKVLLTNDDIEMGLHAQPHGERILSYEDFGKKVFKTEKEAKERLDKIEELERQLRELRK